MLDFSRVMSGFGVGPRVCFPRCDCKALVSRGHGSWCLEESRPAGPGRSVSVVC